MKSLRWFSLLIALVTVGPLLTACSLGDGNSATPPAAPASNAPAANTPVAVATVKPPYPGAVDRKDCEAVGGWVINGKDSSAEIKVELYIDDKLIETLPATSLRPDLTSWGNGLHGFAFKTPAAAKDGKPHTIKVKVAGSDYQVPFFQHTPTLECKAS